MCSKQQAREVAELRTKYDTLEAGVKAFEKELGGSFFSFVNARRTAKRLNAIRKQAREECYFIV